MNGFGGFVHKRLGISATFFSWDFLLGGVASRTFTLILRRLIFFYLGVCRGNEQERQKYEYVTFKSSHEKICSANVSKSMLIRECVLTIRGKYVEFFE